MTELLFSPFVYSRSKAVSSFKITGGSCFFTNPALTELDSVVL